MKKIDKNKSLTNQNQGLVNFTKFQLGITDKLVKREATATLDQAIAYIQQGAYPEAIDTCNEAVSYTHLTLPTICSV